MINMTLGELVKSWRYNTPVGGQPDEGILKAYKLFISNFEQWMPRDTWIAFIEVSLVYLARDLGEAMDVSKVDYGDILLAVECADERGNLEFAGRIYPGVAGFIAYLILHLPYVE